MQISLLLQKFKQKYPERKVRQFIFTFYAIGIVGLVLPATHVFFVYLIPLALLLSAFILLPFQEDDFSIKTGVLFTVIFVVSFTVEAIGVNTGKIFGQYFYENGLGVKCFGTPLIIGLNWALLVYLTASIFQSFRINKFFLVLFPSVLMVLYDVVLEQVAPKMQMWFWEADRVPFRNYLVWFLMALIFHTLLVISGLKLKNPLSKIVFSAQFLFFLILMFIL